jgi:hypothetical protein
MPPRSIIKFGVPVRATDSLYHADKPQGNASTFSTTFPSTENPMSQGGIWTQGGTVGLDWQNVQTIGGTPGHAIGTGVSFAYDDCIATLQNSGFSHTKHWVEIIARVDSGYVSASSHEFEILGLFTIGAHSAAGYELDFVPGLILARWNGAQGDFTSDCFTTISGSYGTPGDGERVRAEFDSSSGSPIITIYSGTGAVGSGLTGLTQQFKVTDTTAGKIVTGNPGQGHFYRPEVDPTDFVRRSIRGFAAGDL